MQTLYKKSLKIPLTKHYIKKWETRTPLNTNGQVKCSVRVNSSFSTSGSCCITVKQHKHQLIWKSCWPPVYNNKKTFLSAYVKRVIAHPSFNNIGYKECEKILANMDQGEAIIRPSSKVSNLTFWCQQRSTNGKVIHWYNMCLSLFASLTKSCYLNFSKWTCGVLS